MQEHYHHVIHQPKSGAQKALVAIVALAVCIMFAGIFALSVSALSSAENDTAASTHIKFYNYPEGAGAGGYDVVSYFSGEAKRGDAKHSAQWGGQTWHFATAENRDLFLAHPARYIPQYGGHCAYGVAGGYLVRGDPNAWSVKDGKLYLNYNTNIRTAWLADAGSFLAKSEANWPGLNK